MGPEQKTHRSCDVAVIGAGAVGMALAIGLAQAGVRTVLIGRMGEPRPGRTVALLAGSVRLLETLGVWPRLSRFASPLARMRIVDATGSLFRPAPVQFEAAELGLDAFGFNIVNGDLDRELAEAAAETPDLGLVPGHATGYRFGADEAVVEIEGHGEVRARLVIAADGRQSPARKAARIGVRTRAWPQVALTGLFRHALPHGDTSVEFHTREGPFTLVPLPPTADAPFRSSLVWVMQPDRARRLRGSPQAFAEAAERQAERLFGRMILESDIGAFPISTSVSVRLTAPRLVLAGEAGHALPPIGAQGLNLSFRDATSLIDLIAEANKRGADPGEIDVRGRYEQVRRGDVSLRTVGVDLLNGSLLARSPLGDLAHGGGLAALAAIGPLRRMVMRNGLLSGPAALTQPRPREREALPHSRT